MYTESWSAQQSCCACCVHHILMKRCVRLWKLLHNRVPSMRLLPREKTLDGFLPCMCPCIHVCALWVHDVRLGNDWKGLDIEGGTESCASSSSLALRWCLHPARRLEFGHIRRGRKCRGLDSTSVGTDHLDSDAGLWRAA